MPFAPGESLPGFQPPAGSRSRVAYRGIDEHLGGGPRSFGGGRIGVQDPGRQAAVDEQGELAGEQVGVGGAGAAGQVGDPGADDTLVLDGAGVHVAAGGRLGGGVDERAAVVAVATTGRPQRVEHADELVPGSSAGGAGSSAQLAEPDLVDLVE